MFSRVVDFVGRSALRPAALILRLALLALMVLMFFATIGAYAQGEILGAMICALIAGACAEARARL